MRFVVILNVKINLEIEENLKINFHQKTNTAHSSILPYSCNEKLKEMKLSAIVLSCASYLFLKCNGWHVCNIYPACLCCYAYAYMNECILQERIWQMFLRRIVIHS